MDNPPNDKKGYNRKDIEDIANKNGWKLNKAAMEAFRRAMPDEYINKTGGAPTQD